MNIEERLSIPDGLFLCPLIGDAAHWALSLHLKQGRIAGDMTHSLFSKSPLAEVLRPRSLADVVGQPEVTAAMAARQGGTGSVVLWGPPGTGKTTLARILGEEAGQKFVALSAVFDGVAELRRVFGAAEKDFEAGLQTLLFIDEIHRFNKAQQDALLPVLEKGVIRLVGATTENPSFSLNGALLSRLQVLVLHPLDTDALLAILSRAEAHLDTPLPLTDEARHSLAVMADGDGRYLLNLVETLYEFDLPADPHLGPQQLAAHLARRPLNYDRAGDEHYNLISALHKSLRASDCDAALYWLARMVLAGEDQRYILRRLTRFASEDIGLAAPEAVGKAIAAWQSFERLGAPEGDLALAELVIFLATAPKSNAAYVAWKAALKAARTHGTLMPPKHILNAPTALMKELDYGAGYKYDHDDPDGFSAQNCFPDSLARPSFYQPAERGFEREIGKRLAYWDRLRAQKTSDVAGEPD